jgi:flagellar basal body-associated protein FliL
VERVSKKKVVLILLVILLAAGGVAGFYWWKSNETTKEVEELKKMKKVDVWNEYATEEKHLHTLQDFLISAGSGDYVVKMTLTVDFKDDESYLKFLGHKSKEEGEKAMSEEGGHGGGDEAHLTPMEIAMNDAVGQLMLEADDNQIHSKSELKKHLYDNLYKKLHLKENNLHGLYIENYVIQ